MSNLVGKVVDNYKILKVLGRGGMGTVFQAMDVSLEKNVALKMLDPRLVENENFLKRFLDEPKLQAKLESPYIVRVFAFRKTDVGFFMVMEFVDGINLADKLRSEGPMQWQKALPLFDKMLQAFDHAHNVGIIHRDIKPANVLLNARGDVKITDFGLAKYQETGDFTKTQTVAGTVKYMPPEQVRGLTNVDHRGDVYALGITLYEMLAGRVPFRKESSQGADYELLKAIVENPAPPPTQFNSTIPQELSDIIMKSIEKDRENRFQTMAEFRLAIHRFVHNQKQNKTSTMLPGGNTLTQAPGAPSAAWGEETTIGQVSAPSIAAQPQQQPQTPPPRGFDERPSQQIIAGGKSSGGWMKWVALLAIVAIGITAGYFVMSGPGGDLPVSPEYASIDLKSIPAGATILLNGKTLGQTPQRFDSLATGKYSLELVLNGYEPWREENLRLEANTPYYFKPELVKKAAPIASGNSAGQATFRSNPEGANIYLNGRDIGITPLSNHSLPPGNYSLRIEKNGYEAYKKSFTIRRNGSETIDANLDLIRQPEGKLVLRAIPSGSISVDGQKHATNQSGRIRIDAPVGKRRIVFEHPRYGRKEATINVRDNKTHTLTCYFTQTVALQSLDEGGVPTWATIIIDGKRTEKFTQTEMTFIPGDYRVTVARQGFETIEGEMALNIRPAFEDKKQKLIFRLRKR